MNLALRYKVNRTSLLVIYVRIDTSLKNATLRGYFRNFLDNTYRNYTHEIRNESRI